MANKQRKIEKIVARQADEATKDRDKECLPVAYEILKRIGGMQTPPIGYMFTQEVKNDYYNNMFVNEIEPVIRAANLRTIDVGYVLSLVLEAFDLIQNKTLGSVTDAVNKASAKKWGKNDLDDIRISDVIEAQKIVV